MAHLLTLNYIGLLLVILGIIFIVAEMFIFSFGVLGVSGFIAFISGLIILFNTEECRASTAFPIILTIGIVVGFLLFMMVYLRIRTRKKH